MLRKRERLNSSMATSSSVREKSNTKLAEPKKYKVIMHNDDFTTMEFVVDILIKIFHKSPADAQALMLLVHRTGMAVIAVYPYDIAATKVVEATRCAQAAGFPFRVTMEEE